MKSLFVTLIFAATATVASAQLINPSFETGDFTGWTVAGGVDLYTDGALTGVEPLDGAFYASLSANSSVFQTAGIHLRAGETVSVWMNGTESNAGGTLFVIPNSGSMLGGIGRPST